MAMRRMRFRVNWAGNIVGNGNGSFSLLMLILTEITNKLIPDNDLAEFWRP